jgi:hypothetical protein
MPSFLLIAFVVSLFVLDIQCWRVALRLKSEGKESTKKLWIIFAGASANSLGFIWPLIAVLYGIYIDSQRNVRAEDIIDFSSTMPLIFFCGLSGIVAGTFGPRGGRLCIILAGTMTMFLFFLTLGGGVL